MIVDRKVCEQKFEEQRQIFDREKRSYQERGLMLIDATFPEMYFLAVAQQVQPACVLCGVRIDFTNYDVWPPSVRLVSAKDRRLLKANELNFALTRFIRRPNPTNPTILETQAESLLQSYGPDDIPFLCMRGIREYHEHPAHSGDCWLLHRGTGPGTLVHILDSIERYGIRPIAGLSFHLDASIKIAGYSCNPVIE